MRLLVNLRVMLCNVLDLGWSIIWQLMWQSQAMLVTI
jgi:hypothetical protein